MAHHRDPNERTCVWLRNNAIVTEVFPYAPCLGCKDLPLPDLPRRNAAACASTYNLRMDMVHFVRPGHLSEVKPGSCDWFLIDHVRIVFSNFNSTNLNLMIKMNDANDRLLKIWLALL